MEENQSLIHKVKDIEDRLKKIERIRLEENKSEIEELKNDLELIKKKINKAIILIPVVEEEDEESKKFIEEQTFIDGLLEKYEGEILAFTRENDKLKLVAHALYRDELMDLIGKAYNSNEINKDSPIFYR